MRLPWKRREQWQERLGRNKTILWEKLREALASVVPITVIVLILSFTVAPIPTETLLAFLIGAVMVILGIGLFSLGADTAMTPIGERVGAAMTRSRKVGVVAAVGFLIGVIVTVSEPDLQVLAQQVPGVPNATLVGAVAVGVGVFLVIAMLRILFRIPLNRMLIVFYILVFALVGFWMMGRVDRFLNAARAEQEGRQHAECLKIAASDPCVMQPVFKTVSALKEQHPDLWCELSFGREEEGLGCTSTGNVDVAILPGETGGGAAFESRDFLFSPVSFRAVEDCTTLSSIDTSVRRQRVLLKQNTSASLAAEFVQRICEQKP